MSSRLDTTPLAASVDTTECQLTTWSIRSERNAGLAGTQDSGTVRRTAFFVAPTQDALYAEIDLELSWSERDLPERERTKHVHRLHPYLGKFIPQLVEAMLGRYVAPDGRVLDPFAGSGTTLVQSLGSGYDAVGVEIAAFNRLLVQVKTRKYDLFALETEIRDVVRRVEAFDGEGPTPTGYAAEW